MQQDVTPKAEEAATDAANRPIQVFRIDDVSVGIFARKREVKGATRTFYDTSFSRSYRGESGRVRYTRTFGFADLEKLIALANQAHDYIRALQADERAPVPVTMINQLARTAK